LAETDPVTSLAGVGAGGGVVGGVVVGPVGLSELHPTMVIATPLNKARADFLVNSRRLRFSNLASISSIFIISFLFFLRAQVIDLIVPNKSTRKG
jgi:hypothetical protein